MQQCHGPPTVALCSDLPNAANGATVAFQRARARAGVPNLRTVTIGRSLAIAIAAVIVIAPQFSLSGGQGAAHAQASDAAEKEAFAAAKELGTADAWNAFLANYSTGFHADLARAYLKKVTEQAAPAQPPPPADDFPVVAGSWGGIVRDGPGQNYGKIASLDEGEQVTLMGRTEVMEGEYPWFKIAYDDGKIGYQWGGILCATGPERADIFKTCTVNTAKPKSSSGSASKSCSSGQVRIDGKCMRKSAASSYCGPGYRPQGGKCVQGYQAPPANAPMSSEQRKAVNKGCPRGQVWNAAEGCHEDD